MRIKTYLCILSSTLAAAAHASAQDTREALGRRELIRQAEEARDAGDHTRALERATSAAGLHPGMTPSLRLLVASEHNSLGHTLDALEHAERCAREAEADPSLRSRGLILRRCRELADSLRDRVARVSVRVPDPAPDGLEVNLQGGTLHTALWGVPVPVLPGAVEIDARTPDGGRFHQRVMVSARDTREVQVVLTREAQVVITRETAAGGGVDPPIVGRITDEGARRDAGAGPWVVAGVGAASLGAAAVFGLLRGAALDDRAARCDTARRVCDPSAQEAQSRAETMSALVNVTVTVGAVALAGGAVWWLLGRSRPESARRSTWNLHLAPYGEGMFVGVGGVL